MLILSRKTRQAIKIGEGIVITVVAVRGKQVRFGIEAPPDVRIRREELPPLPPLPSGPPALTR
jgi:carbon storage regulator